MSEPSTAPPPSTRRYLPVLAILFALAGYAAFHAWQARQPYEFSGTVEAHTADVGSRTGGRVAEVLVREGDVVQMGQVLVRLEPGDLEAQRLQAEGQLAQALANQEKLERGARPEEIEQARARATSAEAVLEQTRAGARREQIGAAEARLAAQTAVADKARRDADRVRLLFSKGASSRLELDTAEAQLRTTEAQREALAQTLEELRAGARREELDQARARAREAEANAKLVQAGSRVEDIRAARGVADAAKGRLQAIQIALGELEIRAPRAARVEALDLRPGDLLPANATAARLVEEGQLFVRIYVPETRLGFVRVGQEVPIFVDAFPARPFQGVIEHINSVGEYTPRNLQTADERANQVFAARVRLKEGQPELRAGMAAFIQVRR